MELTDWFLVTRLVERIALSTIIIVLAILLMVVYRKKLQHLNVAFDGDGVGSQATITLALPIFLYLALILYAWVSLSNPVTAQTAVESGRNGAAAQGKGLDVGWRVSGFGSDTENSRELARTIWRITNEINAVNKKIKADASKELLSQVNRLKGESDRLSRFMYLELEKKFRSELVTECMPGSIIENRVETSECAEFNDYLLGGS